MLVLRRTQRESIYIGPDIELTVVEISGNRVKLGLTAPSDVEIRRSELGKPRRRPSEEFVETVTVSEPSADWTLLEAMEPSLYIG